MPNIRSTEALAVLCPTCLAKPDKPCRSVLVWERGETCMPHKARRLRAAKLAVGEDRGFNLLPGGQK